MTHDLRTDRADSLPLLMRFLSPLEPPIGAIAYDRQAGVNMLAGQSVPAVAAGFDVKTLGAVAED